MNLLFSGPFLVSLVMVGMGFPLALGKVRRNERYGFRTVKTLSSDVIWRAANRYLGRAFVAMGSIGFVVTMSLFLVARHAVTGVMNLMVASLVMVLMLCGFSLVASAMYVKKL